GMFACLSRSATAGSRTMPSAMPRKITLLVVGMRLNTGAEPVGGGATGVGVGCSSRPRPGLRSFGVVVVVVGGAVVVVVRGTLVVVVVVVVVDDVGGTVVGVTTGSTAVPSPPTRPPR